MGISTLLLKHIAANFIEKINNLHMAATTGRPIRQWQLQRSDCGAVKLVYCNNRLVQFIRNTVRCIAQTAREMQSIAAIHSPKRIVLRCIADGWIATFSHCTDYKGGVSISRGLEEIHANQKQQRIN